MGLDHGDKIQTGESRNLSPSISGTELRIPSFQSSSLLVHLLTFKLFLLLSSSKIHHFFIHYAVL